MNLWFWDTLCYCYAPHAFSSMNVSTLQFGIVPHNINTQSLERKQKYITMANIVKGTGTMALAAFDSGAALKKHEFGRPAPGPTDIQIDIKYCGMCHR
jgi:hypothetical protein